MFGILTWVIIWLHIPSYDPVISCDINICQVYDPTEDIISVIQSHGKVKYRLWCNGLGICIKNGFDCSGLIDNARRQVGYRDGRKLNSARMIEAGDKIHYTDTQRWDYIRMDRIDWSEWLDHIAIVSRWWDGSTIEILDMITRYDEVLPRTIKIINWYYAGKFRIDAMRMDYSRRIEISRKTWMLVRF